MAKATRRVGVSVTRESPWRGTKTLIPAGYGIITGAENMVTTVIIRAAFPSFLVRLYRQREHITDTALGSDYARRTGIDLEFAP